LLYLENINNLGNYGAIKKFLILIKINKINKNMSEWAIEMRSNGQLDHC